MTNTNIANNYQAAIKTVKNAVWPEAKPYQVRNVLTNRQIGLRDFMYDPEGFSIKFESELLAAKQELEAANKLNAYIA